jgi:hypothetical protein
LRELALDLLGLGVARLGDDGVCHAGSIARGTVFA